MSSKERVSVNETASAWRWSSASSRGRHVVRLPVFHHLVLRAHQFHCTSLTSTSVEAGAGSVTRRLFQLKPLHCLLVQREKPSMTGTIQASSSVIVYLRSHSTPYLHQSNAADQATPSTPLHAILLHCMNDTPLPAQRSPGGPHCSALDVDETVVSPYHSGS
ncbi:unnamed protein product [Mesocestoides corti]|uniref:Uncharacterized protein n=1 Tax=Mesocestoides corti TaxID=53468 RepID=A0A0R3UKF7_MESCO|nr:unnamed protein product [Mesocestoides corti]